ncbi:MAG: MFS transporter, partial [Lachnospiraceae bacterium]|nr:MFS transporter [Lachnospiraceae bacterium]
IMFGLGFVVCGLAKNVPMLIIGFGLMCGLGMGLAYGCTISNSVKFFPDKKGLVGGIATASYGISSVIVPPIANRLNDAVGVNNSFLIIGIVTVVVVGIFSLFVEKTPCPNGFAPLGWEAPRKTVGDAGRKSSHEKNWKEMISSPIFYVMIIMLFFGGSFGMMAISQASGMAQKMIGMTPAAAAVVVSVLALFNAAGRIVAGVLSDKLGRINTLTLVYILAIVALGLLFICKEGSVAIFYVGICLIGVCFGAFMGIYPGFTSDNFGVKNSSINYGIMFIGFSASGLAAPLIISNIYKTTGAYQKAFIVAIVMAAVGLALSFMYRALEKTHS